MKIFNSLLELEAPSAVEAAGDGHSEGVIMVSSEELQNILFCIALCAVMQCISIGIARN
ncbi:hypothetical protein [Burkholderia pseudomallei]|uniref:hypothetical protein n=1 Tax=Burkholderia pseudomallei TaxID=28450 RepID=UPI0012B9F4AE|nr:hypothetical protein [Burkholderia pseudomallei]MBM5620363.1 hypothetical protein [Burkholderia pseudomallei]MBM5634759.1 hypothetical protein [Burkholderia pseudomallei]MBM5663155.1 hypothetical protein [Burkholderia pseudomallei]